MSLLFSVSTEYRGFIFLLRNSSQIFAKTFKYQQNCYSNAANQLAVQDFPVRSYYRQGDPFTQKTSQLCFFILSSGCFLALHTIKNFYYQWELVPFNFAVEKVLPFSNRIIPGSTDEIFRIKRKLSIYIYIISMSFFGRNWKFKNEILFRNFIEASERYLKWINSLLLLIRFELLCALRKMYQ